MRRFSELPLMVILMGIGAGAMFVPAAHAMTLGDWGVARAFGYSGVMFLFLTGLIGLATINNHAANTARSQLLALLGCYSVLPLMLSVPLHEAVPQATLFHAWWEMVSSITTTGASVFLPNTLPPSVHLWRALVGWIGGYFTLVTAIAILAPMNLGGFEVLTGAPAGQGAFDSRQASQTADPSGRLMRYALRLAPIYAGLTLILWIGLITAGNLPLVAASHAMSTLSTSGISPVGGLAASNSGVVAEMMIFVVLGLALSRRLYPFERIALLSGGSRYDQELRLGVAIVVVVPVFLFVRHWIGALEVDEIENFSAAARSLWGATFTTLSFLTTTGFQSADWTEARAWSGLPTPGLVLAGLAVIGGGVATTAGGVKLLRVYALFRHGEREIEKLIHPSSVGGAGTIARRLRSEGARIAWVFFMLFAMSIALVMLALSLCDLSFESTIVLAVAALSTTGPLAGVATESPIVWGTLTEPAKAVLAVAMVLGRLETLAIIALLNPDFWRR